MTLFGLALLPDEDTREEIIEFQRRHRAFLPGPQLGALENLPHVSVLQCPFTPSTPVTRGHLERIAARLDERPVSVVTELVVQPVGWIFANVAQPAWLSALQQAAVNGTEHLIDVSAIDRTASLEGHTRAERRSYRKFGYRYVGPAFKPHITLGRTVPGQRDIPGPLLQSFYEELTGKAFEFSELVYYRAGEFGALSEVLARVDLGAKKSSLAR